MELILEKGYDAVKVQDVAERANVGRATFYLHYKGGKEELLLSNLEAIYDELVERIKPVKSESSLYGNHRTSRFAFEHAAEHQDLYLIILHGQGAGAIARRIREYLAGVIQSDLEAMNTNSPIPVEIVANYLAGSLVTLITWWLENGMPHSAEYMAETFAQLTLPGIRDMIGND
jgi:AcrR family transcriptional regulator